MSLEDGKQKKNLLKYPQQGQIVTRSPLYIQYKYLLRAGHLYSVLLEEIKSEIRNVGAVFFNGGVVSIVSSRQERLRALN